MGQNWQILTSPAARVIFPAGMDSSAQRIASVVNYMDTTNRRSVGPDRRRIDIVLQNRTVNANGYVALAPFRSEFFGTPPASSLFVGATNWLDLLAVHEYRHVQQYTNARRGIVKWLSWLQGESIWAGLNALVLPNWYYEGDAVITETALTQSGRGRSPFFTLEQRALAQARKHYPYEVLRNGSFRLQLPNHYPLGYTMLTALRNTKGNDITAKVVDEAVQFDPPFYSFSRALKRNTGYTTKRLYKKAFQDFDSLAAARLRTLDLTPTTTVTPASRRTVTTYSYPIPLDDSSLFVRKRSYKTTDRVVMIKDRQETTITTIGFNNDAWLSEGNGLLAWPELTKNPRRGYNLFSDVVTYDLKTGTKKRLTRGERYFSPAVSPEGSRVAVIHISPEQQNEIRILDAATGAIQRRIANPENYFLSRLAWTADGQSVITIARSDSRLSLLKVAVAEGGAVQLTPWSAHTMDSPSVHGDRVYFNAGYSGIDNIYSVDLAGSQTIAPVTSVPVGAFEPSVRGDSLYFTEFTAQGTYVAKQSLNDAPTEGTFIIQEPSAMPMYSTMATAAEGGNILDKVQPADFPVTKYNGLFRGLKFHSWNLEPSIATPGVTLGIVNLLNDVQIDLGGGINRNENNAPFFNASIRVARFYPDITLSATQSQRATQYLSGRSPQLLPLKFNETRLGLAASLPHSWLRGNFVTSFVPMVTLNYRRLSNLTSREATLPDLQFADYRAGMRFSTLKRQAYQNVGTRLGVSFTTEYNKTLNFAQNEKGSIKSSVFLPGLAKNHAVEIKLGYQFEPLANLYQYADAYEYPRGYLAPVNDEFRSVSANYALPLLYPEFGFFGITYLKRVRANLFYDYGVGDITRLSRKTTYNSAGAELILDTTWFNLFPLSLGLRNSFLLTPDPRRDRKYDFTLFFTLGF